MSLNSFLQRITHKQVDDVEVITAERRIQAGDTVAAQAVHTVVRRIGTDAWGEPVYKAGRIEYTIVGYVTSVDLEGLATVRYYNEYAQRYMTGQWDVTTLGFIYNETAIA